VLSNTAASAQPLTQQWLAKWSVMVSVGVTTASMRRVTLSALLFGCPGTTKQKSKHSWGATIQPNVSCRRQHLASTSLPITSSLARAAQWPRRVQCRQRRIRYTALAPRVASGRCGRGVGLCQASWGEGGSGGGHARTYSLPTHHLLVSVKAWGDARESSRLQSKAIAGPFARQLYVTYGSMRRV
jgi:hypothetical protein